MAGLQKTRCAHPPVHRQWYRLRHSRRATRKYLQTLHRSEGPDARRRPGTAHLLTDSHQDERQPDTGQRIQQGSTVYTGATRINHHSPIHRHCSRSGSNLKGVEASFVSTPFKLLPLQYCHYNKLIPCYTNY